MEISLIQSTVHDIPDLVRVHTAAFKADQFSNFMLDGREENAHQVLMQKSIKIWLADPTSKLVKAVASDGTVVGWTCWLAKGKDDTSETLPQPQSLKAPNDSETSSVDLSVQQKKEKPRTPAQLLGRLMHSDSMKWEKDSMKGKRYLTIQALATNPSFQCQGIGSKLIKWGTDMADAEGLPCWAHASPAGHHLYTRAGFSELGRSEYDLEKFSDGDRGWGRYSFRYMQRPALDKR
ncbi:ATP-dependent RNA helicase dbp8 [Penicillium atrosanguineum]|uniref:Acetyltransferase n=1 Tax=Penicillium atrosanguineum TaxID=1132637 RepID=A0A9W9U2B3_9EURO|nr:ATP-dependent RNA helicase dbp8 [Penicillium atrosanguineum]KAJ5137246.1 acetyltransferase [Penicillium atrosanguineum]KAJ5290205.1 ATP-dependent RNA helicase dbp8 [Penicillium atrosanguineum]KAJ5308029.1 acetyltransferase [Penicillium atrosanguineum]